MQFQLVARTGQPDFLDLPWELPLEEWQSERLVEVVRGIGRHVVRFVDYDGSLYALKELPRRLADREYRLLRELEEQSMPVVEPGHHQRRLLMLTGLDVQENQARRLLNDLRSFRVYLERKEGRQLPQSVVAYKWLSRCSSGRWRSSRRSCARSSSR